MATLDLNLCNLPKYTQEEPRLIKYFSQIVRQLFPIVQIYVKSMSRMKGTRKKDFSDSEVYMTRLKIVLCPPRPPPSQKRNQISNVLFLDDRNFMILLRAVLKIYQVSHIFPNDLRGTRLTVEIEEAGRFSSFELKRNCVGGG